MYDQRPKQPVLKILSQIDLTIFNANEHIIYQEQLSNKIISYPKKAKTNVAE
jgi:hypothetical protein